jgi:hypothetical protein
MPLLEIIQIRHVTASIRLDETTASQIDQYAAFLQAPADEVVDKALCYVLGKDREFQDFLRTPEAKNARASLRIRPARRSIPERESSSKRPRLAEASTQTRSHG